MSKESYNEKRRQEVIEAYNSLGDPAVIDLLKHLGRSNVRITRSVNKDIKNAFPIPREQHILWVDSDKAFKQGIAITDKGVFIKSPKKDSEVANLLYYFKWDSFELEWFLSSDPNTNKVLSLDRDYQLAFVLACNAIINSALERKAKHMASHRMSDYVGFDSFLKASGIVPGLGVDTLDNKDVEFVQNHSAAAGKTGHGQFAERAINRIDVIKGKDAKVVGDDNAKNGADRIVDGIKIQTKFYKSANETVNAAFDSNTGEYRYLDGDKPMQLEVPKDQYNKAVDLMKKKIREGKVPGVEDVGRAEDIVREGTITYQQAVNLAKPKTIDSLVYDSYTSAVSCSCVFGISFLVTTYLSWRETKDIKKAIADGILSGMKVFGVAFFGSLFRLQFARQKLPKQIDNRIRNSPELFVNQYAIKVMNAVRIVKKEKRIYGIAAKKHLIKQLKENKTISYTVSFVISSVPKLYSLLNKKISASQFIKDSIVLIAGLSGNAIGAAAGEVVGNIGYINGPIGGAIKPVVAIAGGIVGGKIGGVVGESIYEGDTPRVSRLFNSILSSIISEYLLDENEIDDLLKSLEKKSQKELRKFYQSLFVSTNQEKTIRDFIEEEIERIIKRRDKFNDPSEQELKDAFNSLMAAHS